MRSLLLALLLVPLCASSAETTPEEAVSALWRALSNDPGASADAVVSSESFMRTP